MRTLEAKKQSLYREIQKRLDSIYHRLQIYYNSYAFNVLFRDLIILINDEPFKLSTGGWIKLCDLLQSKKTEIQIISIVEREKEFKPIYDDLLFDVGVVNGCNKEIFEMKE